MASGVYKITCIPTGKFYVGSALNLGARFATHKWELKAGRHSNIYLQRAWNKYGPKMFSFAILKLANATDLITAEQYFIDLLGAVSHRRGFNICPTAGNRLGTSQSEDTKEKIAAWANDPVNRAENAEKQKGHKRWLGKKHTEETRNKLSIIARSRPPEFYTNMNRTKSSLGRKHSLETLRKLSIIQSSRSASWKAKLASSAALTALQKTMFNGKWIASPQTSGPDVYLFGAA